MAKLGRIAGSAGAPAVQFDEVQDRYIWDAAQDMMVPVSKAKSGTTQPARAPRAARPSHPEFTRLKTLRDLTVNEILLRRGSVGTVKSVHDEGRYYLIRFDKWIVTVIAHHDVELAHPAPELD
jgi:hypothetical protein